MSTLELRVDVKGKPFTKISNLSISRRQQTIFARAIGETLEQETNTRTAILFSNGEHEEIYARAPEDSKILHAIALERLYYVAKFEVKETDPTDPQPYEMIVNSKTVIKQVLETNEQQNEC